MKRIFRGVVSCRRSVDGLTLQLWRPLFLGAKRAVYCDFQKLARVSCRKGEKGVLCLKLRLIGSPSGTEQVWSDDEQYQANRLVVNYSQETLWFGLFTPSGDGSRSRWVVRCCAAAMATIFPGLAEAIGKGKFCEVEITVEKDRTAAVEKKSNV